MSARRRAPRTAMSVYTPVSPEELDAWLARYAVGRALEQSPIASGIENTNYFVTTAKGRFVLTLYERLPAEELPFYLNLMAHLARAGVEAPAPDARPQRRVIQHAQRQTRRTRGPRRRRADRCAGHSRIAPPWARRSARLHIAARATVRACPTGAGRDGGARRRARCARSSTPAQNALLAAELKFQAGFGKGRLPRGAIHGDLFCDNVLFVGDRVSGIIDFGFAATDFLAYDLAITVNDWCIADGGDTSGALDARARRRARQRVPRRAPAERRRARAMGRAVARGGAALLAVAALRPLPAAARRAHPRARPGALRAHPARPGRATRAYAGAAASIPSAGAAV